MQRLADLRGILHYVPQYRERLFVIALDGRIVADSNLGNILLDIALLRSLRIEVVLVHGAGYQIQEFANRMGQTPSNHDGTGITDASTLELAITCANRVTHQILEGFSAIDLAGAYANCIVANPAGILRGIDFQFTGRVERIEKNILRSLLDNQIIPVISPLGIDGQGQTYRLNSDAVAVEVAAALQAVKLVFLTPEEGIRIVSDESKPELIRQLAVEEAEKLLHTCPEKVPPLVLSKLKHAIQSANKGVPRIHIIDGRVEEGLLAEVFSNAGIGTLVHANEYQAIRPAQKKDARAIHSLIRNGIENEELLQRTQEEIENQIENFFVFDIDGIPVACIALHYYPPEKKAEMACVCVHPNYENQRIGGRLMSYTEAKAREMGAVEIFCLSTQTFNYFVKKGGYVVGTPEDLPASRKENYDRSGRKSLVLIKRLE